MTTSTVNMVQKPPPPPEQFLDSRGYVSRAWINFLMQLQVVSNTALEATDSGTLAMLGHNVQIVMSKLNDLESRIKALEIRQSVSIPIEQKQKESSSITNNISLLVQKSQDQLPSNNIFIEKKDSIAIHASLDMALYDRIVRRIEALEVTIST